MNDITLKAAMTEARALVIITRAIKPSLLKIRMNKDSKRRSILFELIETEKNYVNSLIAMDEIYYRPLDQSISSKKPLIDSAKLSQLFGNIDEIRETHESGLLKVMNEISPQLRTAFPPPSVYLKLSSAFIELLPRMEQLYTLYLKTNETADSIVTLLKKNKAFKEFVASAIFNPKAKCRSIEDFIILPLQRVAGYRCLFERILKYFASSDPEVRQSYKNVLDAMIKLGATMNQEKAQANDQEQLLNVSEAVSKKPPFLCLLKPGRRLPGKVSSKFLDENTGKKLDSAVIYIFTDIILIAKKQKGGFFSSTKYVYFDTIPISQIRFSVSPFDSYIDKAFVLKSDTREVHLMMKNNKKRDSFINFIKKAKKSISQKVREQSANGAAHMQKLLEQIASLYTDVKPLRTRDEVLNSL